MNCGAMLKHADKFCYNCGAKKEDAMQEIIYDVFCLRCDKQLSGGDRFCRLCGKDATLKRREPREEYEKAVVYE